MAGSLTSVSPLANCIGCGALIQIGGPHDCPKAAGNSTDLLGYAELSSPVSQFELNQSLDNLAWEIAQKLADELPPYLEDSDLTAERFHERNKDRLSKKEAVLLLDRMVAEGVLEKQTRRRRGKSGARAVIYVKA